MKKRERRRPESLHREELWSDARRREFRKGLEARRGGNGVEVEWSRDTKGVWITGRDTIIIVMLALGITFISYVNWNGFRDVSREHATAVIALEEFKCVLALPPDVRINAIQHPDGACNYLLRNYKGGQ